MIIQIFYMVISHISLKVLPNIYQHIYSRCRSHQVWMSLRRKDVLISGATGNIGRGLAMKFAERGMRVILVGRDEAKLKELQKYVQKSSECYVHVANHTRSNNLSFVDNYDIGVLVNCASFNDSYPRYFVEQSIEEIVNVNLMGTMLLTKRVLANMMENRYGYVLNIGSLIGEGPSPLHSAFGSSKHALKCLSDSLYYELETYNVNVEYVNAGSVISDTKGFSMFAARSDKFAESVLSTFGSGRMSVPYIPHFLLYLLLLCIPSPILGRLAFHRNQKIMAKVKEKEASFIESKTK